MAGITEPVRMPPVGVTDCLLPVTVTGSPAETGKDSTVASRKTAELLTHPFFIIKSSCKSGLTGANQVIGISVCYGLAERLYIDQKYKQLAACGPRHRGMAPPAMQ
ncbi:MAG: hypothetical protein WBO06_06725 [Gammaproteobacteria bacterium]